MQKNSFRPIAVRAIPLALALALTGCGIFGEKIDETKNWTAQKLYAEAREEMDAGGYERAIQHFEKLESRYPFGTYAQQAQMEVAYAYYKMNDQAQALAAVERFIKLHPNHPSVDYMYYLRGLVNFNDKLGLLDFIANQDPTERDPKAAREAFDAFRELVQRFPNSKYAPDAVSRMKYLVNALAQHEVHVARYYLRRGAFVAAANRAQTVVKDYQGAPAVEEALFLMTRAYDALNLPELRDDAGRVLQKNFPDSAFLKGDVRKEAPWWKFW
ncbi:MAG TPA: outer membrane protein assembly factor BamD [Paucimonas sp.]|nr:outer membrane protein assembly factor BamD [Paucimonas sp.]